MQYTIEKLENAKSKVSFVVDAEEWLAARTKAYQKTKHKYRIDGFRPGKASQKAIERYYGEAAFYEDAIDILLEDGYKKLLDENEAIVPVTRPDVSIDSVASDKLEFSLTIQEMPEIEIKKYKGLKVERVAAKEITDEMVEAEVNKARERLATWTPITDRPAAMGDKVNIDYKGLKDGEAFAGGTAEKQDLELGSHSFIPGFEEGVVGMNIGDEKEIALSFPEDYGAKELAGQAVVFIVKLNAIDLKQLPEADDEFAKDLGEFDTIAEYRDSIRKGMIEKAESEAAAETENNVMEAINLNATVTLPQELIEERAEEMVRNFAQRLEAQGMKFDLYLKYTGTKEEDVKKQYIPQAEKSIRMEMIVAKVAKLEDIKFTQKNYDSLVDRLFSMYAQPDQTREQFVEYLNGTESMKSYVEDQALTETVLEYLVNANVAKK